MGSCQCRRIVTITTLTKYDLHKRHDHGDPLEPFPTSRSIISRFDTIKTRSLSREYGNQGGVKRSRVLPRDVKENAFTTEKSENQVITISAEKTQDIEYDCDTISNKSILNEDLTDKDSDLGSEYASSLNNSDRSQKTQKHVRILHVSSSGENDDAFIDNSLESDELEPELDQLEASQYSTFFGTISERPYQRSRLGQRQVSHTSQDSREVLQWKKGNRIGRGGYGTVWLGMTVTGELIAVKQIELIETDPHEVEKEYAKIYEEVCLLKELKHKNIVKYLGSSYEKDINHIISVFMQFVPGGSLASIIQKFGMLEEQIVARYTRQLLDSVAYLHSNNIVHRDIKSANILLMPDGVIKLIDFGCAKRLALRLSRSGSHLQKSLKGTPYWMAPEVINETGHGKKSDIWSVGCTVFEMLTSLPPWADREPLAAIYAIGSDEFPVPHLPEQFSNDAREFVRLSLIRDKHKRPAATKLLTHQFLNLSSFTISNSSNNSKWCHRRIASLDH